MKYLYIILVLLLAKQLNAQVKTISYKIVPLVEDRQYELDGGVIVLNTSRVIIPVNLPENTIEWYYMFASYSNEDVLNKRTSDINLATKLSLALDQTGLTSALVSTLLTPNGSSSSNIYVFGDRYNAVNFVNKTDWDLFPEYWKYYDQVSIESATHGKQVIRFAPKEQFYIGIQAGPSPVLVDVEIVAIVDESVTDYSMRSESAIAETKEYNMATTYGNLGWQYYEEGNLEKAIEYSLKALELHSSLGYVHANLGLFNLIKGNHDQADEFYIEAIMNFKNEKLSGRNYVKAAIDDINVAKKTYKEMTGYEAILKELQREFDNW